MQGGKYNNNIASLCESRHCICKMLYTIFDADVEVTTCSIGPNFLLCRTPLCYCQNFLSIEEWLLFYVTFVPVVYDNGFMVMVNGVYTNYILFQLLKEPFHRLMIMMMLFATCFLTQTNEVVKRNTFLIHISFFKKNVIGKLWSAITVGMICQELQKVKLNWQLDVHWAMNEIVRGWINSSDVLHIYIYIYNTINNVGNGIVDSSA